MKQEKPVLLTHFTHQIPLPDGGSITDYASHHTSSKNKKSKHKLDQFTYYYLEDKDTKKIIKVLFKNENELLNQS